MEELTNETWSIGALVLVWATPLSSASKRRRRFCAVNFSTDRQTDLPELSFGLGNAMRNR
jgi:hypothetical protein